MSADPMTPPERRELVQFIRQYVRSVKTRADAHAAQLALACAEELARKYEADDAAWADAVKEARREAEKANERIREAFARQGLTNRRRIPKLESYWIERGETFDRERRAELEKVANAQAKLVAKAGIARAEELAEEFQRRALTEQWSWSQALDMVKELLPPAPQLMPSLDPKVVHQIARQEHAARHWNRWWPALEPGEEEEESDDE